MDFDLVSTEEDMVFGVDPWSFDVPCVVLPRECGPAECVPN